MEKFNKINKCIQSLREKGKAVNPDTIIVESLFSKGGTLTEADKPEICTVLDEIRERISRRVERKYKSVAHEGLGLGFIVAVEVNGYFNY